MEFLKKLYLGESIARKKSRIIRGLNSGKLMPGIYVICLSASDQDLLDLIPSFMLFRESVKKRKVVGLAASKQEAYQVCQKIVEDVYDKTGTYDIRSFLA